MSARPRASQSVPFGRRSLWHVPQRASISSARGHRLRPVRDRLVRRAAARRRLALAAVAGRAAVAVGPVRLEPAAGVGAEGLRGVFPLGVGDPEVARRAAVHAVEVGQPDLLQAAGAVLGRPAGRLARLDRTRTAPATRATRRGPPSPRPRRRSPGGRATAATEGEREARARRRGRGPRALHHGHTQAQFGPRKNVPTIVTATTATATTAKTAFATRRSGANQTPTPRGWVST